MATKINDKRRRIPCGVIFYPGGPPITAQSAYVGTENRGTADFSRRKPDPLTNTPMTVRKFWRDDTHYYATLPSGKEAWGEYQWVNGEIWRYPLTIKHLDSEAGGNSSAVALIRARAKFTGEHANFGESLGEIRQTHNMVAGRLLQVGRMARALRKGDWKALERELDGPIPKSVRGLPAAKRLASGFLEVRYGWQPLIQDVYDLANLQASRFARGTERTKRSGGAPKNDAWSGTQSDSWFNGSAGVTGTVENPTIHQLNALGLLNPSQTAWNLLPYSHVADWASLMSQFLGSLTFGLGLSGLRSWRITVTGNEQIIGSQKFIRDRVITRFAGMQADAIPLPKFFRQVQWSFGKVAEATSMLVMNVKGRSARPGGFSGR